LWLMRFVSTTLLEQRPALVGEGPIPVPEQVVDPACFTCDLLGLDRLLLLNRRPALDSACAQKPQTCSMMIILISFADPIASV
jgi:hypothetical protein